MVLGYREESQAVQIVSGLPRPVQGLHRGNQLRARCYLAAQAPHRGRPTCQATGDEGALGAGTEEYSKVELWGGCDWGREHKEGR